MKNIVTVTFNDGEIDKCYADVAIEEYYREILDGINDDESDDNKFKNTIEFIIFSAFLIEANINNVLEIELQNSIHGNIPYKTIWNIIERRSIDDKIDILMEANNKIMNGCENQLVIIKKIYTLRNKLAHFKKMQKELVVGEVETTNIGSHIESLGQIVPDLYSEVTKIKICEWRDAIYEFIQKIDDGCYETNLIEQSLKNTDE